MNAEMIDEELKQACRADDQADPFGAAALALVRAIIRALLNALLARCPDTAHHSLRVARTVVPVAARMGLPQERIRNTRISALLHDTGKIGVEDGVLKKDGPLTPEEYRAIQEHVPIGVRLLEDNGLHRFIPGVQFHHSRPDGKGYPGAILSEIPIEARIIGVLDAVDAMSFPRVYRQEPRPAAEVDEILLKKAGVEWDTEVVGAFLRVRPEIDRLQRPPVE